MRKLVPLSIGLLLILAACGSSTAPTRAPGSTPAPGGTLGTATSAPNQPPAGASMCQVLTVEDVSRITGKPAVIGEAESGEDNCWFNVGAPDEIIPDYTLAFRTETGDLTGPKAGFPGGQDLSGIGDSAYWAPGATVLWFMRGGQTYALQFVLFGEDDGDALAIAQQLAQAALARL